MKKILIFIFLLVTLNSCKTEKIYIPVETQKIEYRERLVRDSVHYRDSVFMKMVGDTIWLEKYKYIYSHHTRVDSLFRNDTIRVPYPVVEIREINRLNSFQGFQIWSGRITLLFILVWLIVRYGKQML